MLNEIVDRWNSGKRYSGVTHGKNPCLLIIGENHTSDKDTTSQIDLLKLVQPEVLVHEWARNCVFDFNLKKAYENPSFPCPSKALRYARRNLDFAELLMGGDSMPETDLGRWLSEKGLESEIGIYEFAGIQGFKGCKFEVVLNNLPSSVRRVVGCDLSSAEKDLYQHTTGRLFSSVDSTKEDHDLREERFADVMHTETKKSEVPVIAIVGSWHIKEGAYMPEKLQRRGVGYIIADQTSFRE